jgi:hypothetical protein
MNSPTIAGNFSNIIISFMVDYKYGVTSLVESKSQIINFRIRIFQIYKIRKEKLGK